MAHQVQVVAGKTNIALPDGKVHQGGDIVTLTDEQYQQLSSSVVSGGILIDLGVVAELSSGSWVDLCSPPYNCTPGTDVTSALQNVINHIATAGTGTGKDTTIYFSQPGVYNLN